MDEDEEDAGLDRALTKTRQLVECAMFASVAGLAYFLSNSLAIEVCVFLSVRSAFLMSICLFDC